MGETQRLESRNESLAPSNRLNYIEIAQLSTRSGPESAQMQMQMQMQPARKAEVDFDDVYRGVTTSPQTRQNPFNSPNGTPYFERERARPIANDQPYYREPGSNDNRSEDKRQGALSSTSLLVFLGGILTGMAKGRGSLQARAVQGLILGGAVEVGRQEVIKKVENTFGF